MKPGEPRRSAILAAAEGVLLSHGPRATSMEAIARAARVAKPTLYAYFSDKDAILKALAEELIAAQRKELHAAMTTDGELAVRVAAALTVRCKQGMRMRAHPHGRDLYGSTNPIAGASVRRLEEEFGRDLETALAKAGVQRARFLAPLLLAASTGIGERATLPSEVGPAVRLLCERMIPPELPV